MCRPDRARETILSNLRFAAEALGAEKITLLVETLNTRDIPGFYLTSTSQVLSLMKEVGHANLFYQYDMYHMQVMEGDLAETVRRNIGAIGHIQVADNPGRHEPGTGEINFANLFRFIDDAGYQGFIGCEYKPQGVDRRRPRLVETLPIKEAQHGEDRIYRTGHHGEAHGRASHKGGPYAVHL